MPRRLPSEAEVLKMQKVSGYGARNPTARQTFLHKRLFVTRKYSIDTPERQAELVSFSNAINPNARVQRVISASGRVAEETYHHGPPVKFGKLSKRQLSIIGRTLAQINRAQVPAETKPIKPILALVERSLTDPAINGVLSEAEKSHLRNYFKLNQPKNPKTALCHNDVHSKNVVRGLRGLRIIDIGDMRVHYIGFELSRAIFGLCKNEAQARILLKAYKEAGGDIEAYTGARKFWDAYNRLSALRTKAIRVEQNKDGPEEHEKQKRQLEKIKKVLFNITK